MAKNRPLSPSRIRQHRQFSMIGAFLMAMMVGYQNCGQSGAVNGGAPSSSATANSSLSGGSGGSDAGVINPVRLLGDWKLSVQTAEYDVGVDEASLVGDCPAQEGSLLIYRLAHRGVVLHEDQAWCRSAKFTVDLRPLMNLACDEPADLEGQMGNERGLLARITRRCQRPLAQVKGSATEADQLMKTVLAGGTQSDLDIANCQIEKTESADSTECQVVCFDAAGMVVQKSAFLSPLCN